MAASGAARSARLSPFRRLRRLPAAASPALRDRPLAVRPGAGGARQARPGRVPDRARARDAGGDPAPRPTGVSAPRPACRAGLSRPRRPPDRRHPGLRAGGAGDPGPVAARSVRHWPSFRWRGRVARCWSPPPRAAWIWSCSRRPSPCSGIVRASPPWPTRRISRGSPGSAGPRTRPRSSCAAGRSGSPLAASRSSRRLAPSCRRPQRRRPRSGLRSAPRSGRAAGSPICTPAAAPSPCRLRRRATTCRRSSWRRTWWRH